MQAYGACAPVVGATGIKGAALLVLNQPIEHRMQFTFEKRLQSS
ncbi:hypothetical protein TM233_61140 [Bradyrhizobium sp. TM233]|nr:hypothetical protein TM233_61140 [Bradyrhizobium sp. TM233]